MVQRGSLGGQYFGEVKRISSALASILGACIFLVGCQPRVELALPDRPIEININAKIEHDVRIRVERDVSQVVKSHGELF